MATPKQRALREAEIMIDHAQRAYMLAVRNADKNKKVIKAFEYWFDWIDQRPPVEESVENLQRMIGGLSSLSQVVNT